MTGDAGQGATHGGVFYDDETVFSRYTAHRQWAANPNVVMEEPAVLGALGDVRGARVIDLGCGDGTFGRLLLDGGCQSYFGIDSSKRMVEAATTNLTGTGGEVRLQTMQGFRPVPNSADLVVSRLAFHYVADIEPVFRACYAALGERGRLVFTVVHPVITSHDATVAGEKRTSWVVDEYFVRGPRHRNWMGGRTTWFHRTVEDYVCALQQSGFRLTRLSECAPTETLRSDNPEEYERRSRVPLFLLLAGEKR